ncbi:MAG: hypothetical protein IPO37_13945 [Saprospiraceae bacterium]|nr:hypothetical protein [Saprospiraceae bacterium]
MQRYHLCRRLAIRGSSDAYRIRQADGSEKVIIIEIQKSKFAHENMRFRKYLGKQYMNESFFNGLQTLRVETIKWAYLFYRFTS